MEVKKKKSRYWLVILIIFFINAILIALALNWLYRSLEKFEAKTPNTALNQFFDSIRAGDFEPLKADSGFVPDKWNTWEDYERYVKEIYSDLPEALTYRKIQGSGENNLTYAVFNGKDRLGDLELTKAAGENSQWIIRMPVTYGNAYTITAPQHSVVTMNGTPLTDDEIVETLEYPVFSKLPEGYVRPYIKVYEIGPTLFEPDIEALSLQGKPCDMQATEEPDRVSIKVTVPVQGEDATKFADFSEDVAKKYSNFISEDIKFSTLASCLLKDTDFYGRMKGYYVGWYVDHDSFDFLDMEIVNIESCSEDYYISEIKFTYEVYRKKTVNSFPSHYQMAFIRVDGAWLLAELKVL